MAVSFQQQQIIISYTIADIQTFILLFDNKLYNAMQKPFSSKQMIVMLC